MKKPSTKKGKRVKAWAIVYLEDKYIFPIASIPAFDNRTLTIMEPSAVFSALSKAENALEASGKKSARICEIEITFKP